MSELEIRYGSAFYRDQVDGSIQSARLVVPYLFSVLDDIRSVVDVGCGTGAWLSVFELRGTSDILGIDGGSTKDALLQITPKQRIQRDLEHCFRLPRTFDLCMSLEVAEHLSPTRAASFVNDLCRLSDRVLFGAAIPGQGGTHHVNEQWASYWIALFKNEGFDCFDVIRPKFWNDRRVEWWYAQNTYLFIRSSNAPAHLAACRLRAEPLVDVVHPQCFQQFVTENGKLRELVGAPSHQASINSQENPQLVSDLRLHIAALESTLSWRITAPLRRVRRLMNAIRHRSRKRR